MKSSSEVVSKLKQKLIANLEDLQSFNIVCDFMECHIDHARPMMTTLFITKTGSTGKCNCLMCIDWLLTLAPMTIDIVEKEIVEYVEELLEDRIDIPGVLYSGTIMKLLPKWEHKLNPSIYHSLKSILDEKIKSGVEIKSSQLLSNIIDQDRERWKRLKEDEWSLPSDIEIVECLRQPVISDDVYQLYEKERDLYFANQNNK